MTTELTIHQRIMRAAKRGTGLRLSASDAYQLSNDHAISAAAEWDDMGREESRAAQDAETRARFPFKYERAEAAALEGGDHV